VCIRLITDGSTGLRRNWVMGGWPKKLRWESRDLRYLSSTFEPTWLNLFMLVSALMGLDVMRRAYTHAIKNEYRFYSYGDGSLLLP
jgi:hypothetical protein